MPSHDTLTDGRTGGIVVADVDLSALPPHIWVRLFDRDKVRRKVRISLVEHCNLGCFFCHNEGQGPIRRGSSVALSPDELERIARVALSEGAAKIKLTGGEPLLYRWGRSDILDVVRRVSRLRLDGFELDLSITTNGSLLPEYATGLAGAGLDRATVSVTTLRAETFGKLISPNGRLLHRSLLGVRAAHDAGLRPLKINVAVYHSARLGIGNLGELRDLVDFARLNAVSEMRLFTLLWHSHFVEFDDFYHFFSPLMVGELESLLREFAVVDPRETVETLARLALAFASIEYPKVEFGVDLGSLRLGFEAMKRGRLASSSGLQEGPYAIRVGADGAIRSTLNGAPSYDLINALRSGVSDFGLQDLYRGLLKEFP
jgi:molybdenum cofactor biosynthesis enzyme MoaA